MYSYRRFALLHATVLTVAPQAAVIYSYSLCNYPQDTTVPKARRSWPNERSLSIATVALCPLPIPMDQQPKT
jgi:hypothetical protein